MPEPLKLHDCEPDTGDMREEVLRGLRSPVKNLPAKLFYDERGSQLFDRICETKEYYPTRTETRIMESRAQEMARRIGPDAMIVEFGSGSSVKTRHLLDALENPAAYVPIDISREHLLASAGRLAADYPNLEVLPVCADYEQQFDLPHAVHEADRCVIYFPGSTIGNFHPDGAVVFLRRAAALSKSEGRPGALLIGVDLKKDRAKLEAAYNDREGVTAAFNLNMLLHINRELGANFDIDRFEHLAFYNETAGRIEMHLSCNEDHTVTIDGERIPFEEGERIWTESSYKYTVEEFGALAQRAGCTTEEVWTDPDRLFSVQYLTT